MVNINLICVGKIKEAYIIKGIAEYKKRLDSYAKFNIIELKESGFDNDREQAKLKEEKEIMKYMEKGNIYNILLDIEGFKFSSENFAEKINTLTVNGVSSFNFIIGGSYGVTEEIRKKSDLKLSFSDFTFPHQLMRLIFIEQLYRWFSILNNTKYHK